MKIKIQFNWHVVELFVSLACKLANVFAPWGLNKMFRKFYPYIKQVLAITYTSWDVQCQGKKLRACFFVTYCFSQVIRQYYVVWIHQSVLSNHQTVSWKSLNKRLMREFIFLSLLPRTGPSMSHTSPRTSVMQATYFHLYHRLDCLIINTAG